MVHKDIQNNVGVNQVKACLNGLCLKEMLKSTMVGFLHYDFLQQVIPELQLPDRKSLFAPFFLVQVLGLPRDVNWMFLLPLLMFSFLLNLVSVLSGVITHVFSVSHPCDYNPCPTVLQQYTVVSTSLSYIRCVPSFLFLIVFTIVT